MATRVAALAALLVGLSGCQSLSMGMSGTAQLRVIDASPDAPALDSYQNNTGLAYGLGFGTVTSYIPMLPGNVTLAADKTGTRQALIASTTSLSAGHQYTSILSNVNAALQQTILLDQSTPAPPNEFAVRLVNEATRAGEVDVYLVPGGSKLSGLAPVASHLSFGSNTGYLNLPAGVYQFAVLPAGTVPVAAATNLLSGAQVEYASGAVRTVVLIDAPRIPGEGTAAAHAATGVQALQASDHDEP